MGINRNSPVPITDQIAADLRRGIADGTLTGRLPAYKALATRYGVAEMTIQAVMKDLQREGLVTTATGRGTFVREPEDSAEPAAGVDELSALRRDVDEMRGRLDALERVVGSGGGEVSVAFHATKYRRNASDPTDDSEDTDRQGECPWTSGQMKWTRGHPPPPRKPRCRTG